MKIEYHRHYRPDAEGHIFLDKKGACTIALTGAAAMTQEELDFYGEIMAVALNNMTPAQKKQVKAFPMRTYGEQKAQQTS